MTEPLVVHSRDAVTTRSGHANRVLAALKAATDALERLVDDAWEDVQ